MVKVKRTQAQIFSSGSGAGQDVELCQMNQIRHNLDHQAQSTDAPKLPR